MLLQFTVMPFLGWALGILFELPFFCCWINLSWCAVRRDCLQRYCFFSQRQCSLIGSHDHLLYLWCHSTHSFFDCHPSGSYLDVDARIVLQYPKSGVGSCKLGSIAQSICQKRNEESSALCTCSCGAFDCINCSKHHRSRESHYFKLWFESNSSYNDLAFSWFYLGLCSQ